MECVNVDGGKVRLCICTQTPISPRMEGASALILAVAADQGRSAQEDADGLLPVEPSQVRERLDTRLSLSTRIAEYLEYGRCVFAIGWRKATCIGCLVDYDPTVVATSDGELEIRLRALIGDPRLVLGYARKPWECGRRNHRVGKTWASLYRDMRSLAGISPELTRAET